MKQIIYVVSSDSQQIYVWEMNSRGALELLQVVSTPGNGQPILIHPAGTYLYVGVRPISGIVSYCIDERGLLTEYNTTPLPAYPSYLTIDCCENTLFSVSYHGNCLTVSSIDMKGIISPPFQILNNLNRCHSVNINTINHTVWVPCLKEDRIRIYTIDKFNSLTPHKLEALSVKIGSGPRHMVFHKNGNYAYVINEFSGTVDVISTNFKSTRPPHIVQTLDMMPFNFEGNRWASDIHITPDNHWIYCCDRTANILSRFLVSKNGENLTFLGYHNTETQPRSFNIDSQGRFLITAGQKSNYIAVYSINNRSGSLSFLSRYKVGKGPSWLSILEL
ncbi:6-phosphogluconolactonase [Sodalis sp. CWE]|uniref:6-phosphogluconolactonase n=1 Tax=Sodalis sp. CWE TaxID=2803816 RepID=UPI001C7D179D|nr:6-phosphogluconolactonase [Sodalis sp. CWE]MBX4180950.1 6-phosphogluconolactonase [Sodalis sp. CWE]